jgi:hypothetical protein
MLIWLFLLLDELEMYFKFNLISTLLLSMIIEIFLKS